MCQASLEVQRERIHLATERHRIWSLIRVDPTCHWAPKPMLHNFWICALEPGGHNYWSPYALEPVILFFFFPFIFISWRLITLKYCSGFCHTLTWISHGFTCIPHPDPPSHLPHHRSLWVFPVHQARTFVSFIQPGLVLLNKSSHRNEKAPHHNWGSIFVLKESKICFISDSGTCSLQLEKSLSSKEEPAEPKINNFFKKT